MTRPNAVNRPPMGRRRSREAAELMVVEKEGSGGARCEVLRASRKVTTTDHQPLTTDHRPLSEEYKVQQQRHPQHDPAERHRTLPEVARVVERTRCECIHQAT